MANGLFGYMIDQQLQQNPDTGMQYAGYVDPSASNPGAYFAPQPQQQQPTYEPWVPQGTTPTYNPPTVGNPWQTTQPYPSTNPYPSTGGTPTLPTVDPTGQFPWSENYPGKQAPIYGESGAYGSMIAGPGAKYNPDTNNLTMGAITNTVGEFNKDLYVKIVGPGGIESYVLKPPKNYDDAGGYQQFIDQWNQWYQNIRKSLGLGDTWNQNDIDKLKAIFDQLGIKFQAKPGEKWSGRIYIPDGKGGFIQVDVINGFVNYGHTEQSGALTGQKPGGGSSATGGGGSGGSGGGGTGGGGTGAGASNPWSDRANTLYDMLLKRANQSLAIDRNDPIIRNQSDAFAAMAERNRRNYLTDTAERAGPMANISAERRSSAEKVGQAISANEAALMGTELKARRQEISDALQGLHGIITFEQELELRDRLGMLDVAIRQAALAEQGREFDANMLQRAFEFDINDEFRRSPLAGGF